MGNKQLASGLESCATLLCLFAGMMIGSVDTTALSVVLQAYCVLP